jgi:hypothetical protein
VPFPRYDLAPATRSSVLFLFCIVHFGRAFQYGLSAAGGVDGFYKHCSAADER